MLFEPDNPKREDVFKWIEGTKGVKEVLSSSDLGFTVMVTRQAIDPITLEPEVRSVAVLGEIRSFMNMAKVD